MPYLLGRPFGAPNNPALQTDVMSRLFGLLDTATEQTLLDTDVEAPGTPARDAWQPGVTFDHLPADPVDVATLLYAFMRSATSVRFSTCITQRPCGRMAPPWPAPASLLPTT
ncbi:MAG: hypothetical protein GDA49_09275 [Rhodospirillales bacterium]|nr:hypothetical protein [Rhodospirillales bacterium]